MNFYDFSSYIFKKKFDGEEKLPQLVKWRNENAYQISIFSRAEVFESSKH